MSAIAAHWAIVRHALDEEKRHATGLVRTSETAFLPAALEIVERPVSPTARATSWVLLALLVIAMLWISLGKIDVVASAPGKVIPADNVKLVQPAEAGVVRAIYVRDGQRVSKGQPLVALDPTVSGAEVEQARKALETAALDAARARAVLGALDGRRLAFAPPEGTPPGIAAVQASLARAELASIEASVSGMLADARVAAAARGEAAVQASKLSETLPLIDEQLSSYEAMLKDGYAGRLQVIDMRRQRLTAVRDRDIALETVRKANAQIASANSGGARTRAEARAKVLGDLARAESDASLRREELVKSSRRSRLQQLLSPVAGIVTSLAVHTIGGVVEPAKPIMVIVPSGSALVVEARLANRDRGFVKVGQLVAVKLEAFPFTRFGTVPGVVESIASDSVQSERPEVESASSGPTYLMRVRLARMSIERSGVAIPLAPGMTATADVRTGRRSIFSYLISPIDEARMSAGRER